MCGLVGMAGEISAHMQRKIFRDMLDICQIRGRDSTGAIKVYKDLDYTWSKQIGTPNMLTESRAYDQTIDHKDACVLIGHTRSKTVGEVSIKNAHPFDYPDEGICGVHNGTLTGYYELDTYHHSKVDSEILYGHLAANGPQETFNKIGGAFACVWWNDKEKTLNFIRNNERPLFFTYSKDLKTMFWASEPGMFWVVSRSLELWDGGEEKKIFLELPVNSLYSFAINPKAKGDEKIMTLKQVRVIEPEKKSYIPMAGNYHGSAANDAWKARSRDWKETSPGVYERVNTRGGSVANPFLAAREKIEAMRLARREATSDLNDPLPEIGSAVEKENSQLSNVNFLRDSASVTDCTTGLKNLKNSQGNILSLPGKSSTPSQRNNKGVPSNDTGSSSTALLTSPIQLLSGVSFRTVAGIPYITDNRTKSEWTEAAFLENTGGVCSFCKGDVSKDLKKIGEILSQKTILCVDCVTEPNAISYG